MEQGAGNELVEQGTVGRGQGARGKGKSKLLPFELIKKKKKEAKGAGQFSGGELKQKEQGQFSSGEMGKGKKGLGRDGEIEERESAKQFSA